MAKLNFSVTQLEYVHALAEHRHFARAAKACHVSQPSLSMQIQKLEEQLGAPVFDRSSQPVTLTDVGVQIAEQARIILKECHFLQDIAHHKGKPLSGTFKVGFIPTVSPSLLPLFVRKFLENYPDVNLEIEEMPTATLLARLHENALDAGVLSTPVPFDGLEHAALYYEPFVLCVPRGHPLAAVEKVTLAQLPAEEMLLLDHSNCFREQIQEVCPAFRASQFRLEKRTAGLKFEAGQLETLRKLVEKGLGITLLPQLMLTEKEILEGTEKLVYKTFSAKAPRREISLLWRPTWLKKPLVEAFLACLQNSVPPDLQTKQPSVPLALFSVEHLKKA